MTRLLKTEYAPHHVNSSVVCLVGRSVGSIGSIGVGGEAGLLRARVQTIKFVFFLRAVCSSTLKAMLAVVAVVVVVGWPVGRISTSAYVSMRQVH